MYRKYIHLRHVLFDCTLLLWTLIKSLFSPCLSLSFLPHSLVHFISGTLFFFPSIWCIALHLNLHFHPYRLFLSFFPFTTGSKKMHLHSPVTFYHQHHTTIPSEAIAHFFLFLQFPMLVLYMNSALYSLCPFIWLSLYSCFPHCVIITHIFSFHVWCSHPSLFQLISHIILYVILVQITFIYSGELSWSEEDAVFCLALHKKSRERMCVHYYNSYFFNHMRHSFSSRWNCIGALENALDTTLYLVYEEAANYDMIINGNCIVIIECVRKEKS